MGILQPLNTVADSLANLYYTDIPPAKYDSEPNRLS